MGSLNLCTREACSNISDETPTRSVQHKAGSMINNLSHRTNNTGNTIQSCGTAYFFVCILFHVDTAQGRVLQWVPPRLEFRAHMHLSLHANFNSVFCGGNSALIERTSVSLTQPGGYLVKEKLSQAMVFYSDHRNGYGRRNRSAECAKRFRQKSVVRRFTCCKGCKSRPNSFPPPMHLTEAVRICLAERLLAYSIRCRFPAAASR